MLGCTSVDTHPQKTADTLAVRRINGISRNGIKTLRHVVGFLRGSRVRTRAQPMAKRKSAMKPAARNAHGKPDISAKVNRLLTDLLDQFVERDGPDRSS